MCFLLALKFPSVFSEPYVVLKDEIVIETAQVSITSKLLIKAT